MKKQARRMPSSLNEVPDDTGSRGLPEGEDASFFLCKELKPGYLNGITGEYATPSGYFVDPFDCDVFDQQFPPKEKKRLPGQLW